MDLSEFRRRFEKKNVVYYPTAVTNNPLVSVCVQTYQHVRYIRQCLDGILMQKTTFGVEILLGEDNSSDGTRQICIAYADKYPDKIRLFLHHRANNIMINGLHTGRFNFFHNLFSANGKYIAICEGDDYWIDPFKLQNQVDFLEANPTFSGTFHETRVEDENQPSQERIYGKNAPDICTVEDTFSTYSLFHTSSFLFRKSSYVLPDWLSEVISADMALFSIAAGFGPIKKIPGVMSVYRKHEGGVTSSPEAINNFRQKRIELTNLLNAYHNYAFTKKAKQVINEHSIALSNTQRTKPSFFYSLKRWINFRQRLSNLLK